MKSRNNELLNVYGLMKRIESSKVLSRRFIFDIKKLYSLLEDIDGVLYRSLLKFSDLDVKNNLLNIGSDNKEQIYKRLIHNLSNKVDGKSLE